MTGAPVATHGLPQCRQEGSPGPGQQYLGCIDGLLVGAVTEQGHPELSGDAAECRDLVGAGAPGVQDPIGGVMQLLHGEEAQALDKGPFYLQGRQRPCTHWLACPSPGTGPASHSEHQATRTGAWKDAANSPAPLTWLPPTQDNRSGPLPGIGVGRAQALTLTVSVRTCQRFWEAYAMVGIISH